MAPTKSPLSPTTTPHPHPQPLSAPATKAPLHLHSHPAFYTLRPNLQSRLAPYRRLVPPNPTLLPPPPPHLQTAPPRRRQRAIPEQQQAQQVPRPPPLFHNPALRRRLALQDAVPVLDWMAGGRRAEWVADKGGEEAWVFLEEAGGVGGGDRGVGGGDGTEGDGADAV
ncbi:hypothetical protein BDR22DRAFT_716567 [Usnea florida]